MKFISNTISFLNPFRKPTVNDLIKSMLSEYELNFVLAESAADYNRKMAQYYKEGITRLKAQNINLIN